MGLRPRCELAKLLLDHGAGAVFHGPAHNGTGSPKLRRECESAVHSAPWLKLKVRAISLSMRCLLNLSIHNPYRQHKEASRNRRNRPEAPSLQLRSAPGEKYRR